MTEKEYMKKAIELAKKGYGFVNPNPVVGAVVVKNGNMIGTGYHEKIGDLHAERNALLNCTEDPQGADLYVTLEPCCHYGRTPPCTEIIIEKKIKRVFVGSDDPNPLVAGKGIEILRNNGIEVIPHILKDECDSLNEIFMHYITTGLPFVTLKYAMTMDGKIAAYTGRSKWITGDRTRLCAMKERLRHSSVMVGSGTVLADDPMLNYRLPDGRDPIRIICDSRLRIPVDSKIVNSANSIQTIVAADIDNKGSEKAEELTDKGCEIVFLDKKDGHIDLLQLMKILGERKIDSVLCEGGGELGYSLLKCGAVSKIQAYIAPKILGGRTAPSPVGGSGADSPDNAVQLYDTKIKTIGDDILLESRVKNVYGYN